MSRLFPVKCCLVKVGVNRTTFFKNKSESGKNPYFYSVTQKDTFITLRIVQRGACLKLVKFKNTTFVTEWNKIWR